MEKNRPLSERISLQELKLEVDSEITQLESPAQGDQIFIGTSSKIYSLRNEGTELRQIVSSPKGLDQFAVSISGKRIIYVIDDKLNVCSGEGKAIKTFPLEDNYVLSVVNFSFFPNEDKIVFTGESAEPGPGGPEISVYRICLLDPKTEKVSLLSKDFYGSVPKLLGWRGKDILFFNADSGGFLFLSTKDGSEEPVALSYSSLFEGGEVESVALSQDGNRLAFSVKYPIERVQIFENEMWKSQLVFEVEGEGGVQRALRWSPNSRWLSYINSWFSSPTLYLIPVASEKREALEASSLDLESKVVWLPKGDGIAFSDGKKINILKIQELISP